LIGIWKEDNYYRFYLFDSFVYWLA